MTEFGYTGRLISVGEREALVSTGSPARPVVVPLSLAEVSPADENGCVRITASREVARSLGLTV